MSEHDQTTPPSDDDQNVEQPVGKNRNALMNKPFGCMFFGFLFVLLGSVFLAVSPLLMDGGILGWFDSDPIGKAIYAGLSVILGVTLIIVSTTGLIILIFVSLVERIVASKPLFLRCFFVLLVLLFASILIAFSAAWMRYVSLTLLIGITYGFISASGLYVIIVKRLELVSSR